MIMPLKIGVIGMGKWGKNHFRIYSDLGCDLVGVSDIDPGVKEMADKHDVRYEKDYQDLLPHVDAVSVVVPTDMHYRVVKDCLMAGKHVLVEKPLTFDPNQARELIDIAKERDLILCVGFLFRFNSAVLKLKDLIREAGDLQYITARYIHSTKPPRMDCGVVFNFASHLIDILNFILDKKPKRIYCKNLYYLSKEREDSSFIVFDYGDFITNLEVSWFHPLKRRDIWIIGSKKKIYADLFEQIVRVFPIEISYEKTTAGREVNVEINKNEPLKEELKSFLRMVEENRRPDNGEEEYEIIKIMDACLKSASLGKEIPI
jgi:UDP-N-acetylglucosamine 3-dehydrogenase